MSVGLKVAVIVAEPAAPTVATLPAIAITGVFEDAYVKEPGVDDVGAVIVYGESP